MQQLYKVAIKLEVLAESVDEARELGQAAVDHLFETFNDNGTINDAERVDAWPA